MKLTITSAYLFVVAVMAAATSAQELPITTTAVFVQSGEATASSVIVMTRCNSERDSSIRVIYAPRGTSTPTMLVDDAYEANDFTAKVLLTGLVSNTVYDYRVQCTANNAGNVTESRAASFRTLPSATQAVALNLVWAADLAGQGWGRNPNLNVTTINGTFIQGGYLAFAVMEALKPDYGLFQGDMIYADNAILPNRTIPAQVGGGLYINNVRVLYRCVLLNIVILFAGFSMFGRRCTCVFLLPYNSLLNRLLR
jgi:alkaline phosphatase D